MATLVKPLITEKMSLLSEGKGQYGFRAALNGNKTGDKSRDRENVRC